MNPIAVLAAVALAAQAAPAPKAEIVSVTGCLREASPNTWTLVSATDPAPSSANAPQPREIPTTPPAGKNEFRLIGVFEFNMPVHKDHTVVVKGLLIKATPTSRINVTSVTMATASCAPMPPNRLNYGGFAGCFCVRRAVALAKAVSRTSEGS